MQIKDLLANARESASKSIRRTEINKIFTKRRLDSVKSPVMQPLLAHFQAFDQANLQNICNYTGQNTLPFELSNQVVVLMIQRLLWTQEKYIRQLLSIILRNLCIDFPKHSETILKNYCGRLVELVTRAILARQECVNQAELLVVAITDNSLTQQNFMLLFQLGLHLSQAQYDLTMLRIILLLVKRLLIYRNISPSLVQKCFLLQNQVIAILRQLTQASLDKTRMHLAYLCAQTLQLFVKLINTGLAKRLSSTQTLSDALKIKDQVLVAKLLKVFTSSITTELAVECYPALRRNMIAPEVRSIACKYLGPLVEITRNNQQALQLVQTLVALLQDDRGTVVKDTLHLIARLLLRGQHLKLTWKDQSLSKSLEALVLHREKSIGEEALRLLNVMDVQKQQFE